MRIVPVELQNRRQVRQFLALPFDLYRDSRQWVPPFWSEARAMLDPTRHPFYDHSQAAFWLALEGDTVVGRIAALENRVYNGSHNCRKGMFALWEQQNDESVAQALLDTAEKWCRHRGLTHIVGPMGLSALDGFGVLIKGFEHRAALGMPYNPPYYQTLIEARGYQVFEDALSGYIDPHAPFPERVHRAAETIKARRRLTVRTLRRRADVMALLPAFRELYNNALGNTYDMMPLTEREVQVLARQVLSFADPRLIKVVQRGDELIGFVLAYPDVAVAVQRCRGRLFPLGWLWLLRETKRTNWVNVNGMGIVEQYRGLGGATILFSELQKSIASQPFDHAEVIQIRTDNERMLAELRAIGVDFYKVHRVYQKAL
jgi:GNAT superfamily N-acetyltransferase